MRCASIDLVALSNTLPRRDDERRDLHQAGWPFRALERDDRVEAAQPALRGRLCTRDRARRAAHHGRALDHYRRVVGQHEQRSARPVERREAGRGLFLLVWVHAVRGPRRAADLNAARVRGEVRDARSRARAADPDAGVQALIRAHAGPKST